MYLNFLCFRKQSDQDLASYQEQLMEATVALLMARDVRAKSADLENRGNNQEIAVVGKITVTPLLSYVTRYLL